MRFFSLPLEVVEPPRESFTRTIHYERMPTLLLGTLAILRKCIGLHVYRLRMLVDLVSFLEHSSGIAN